jgi:hypothetical protein
VYESVPKIQAEAASQLGLIQTLTVCRYRNSCVKSKGLASQALKLSKPQRGCAPSTRQDGALLYPGPLCGGESGTTGRVAGIGTMPIPFRQHRDVLSKSPASTHGLAGHGCPASAKRGVVFSWVLLFWTSKREVPRPPKEGESSCSECNKSIAHKVRSYSCRRKVGCVRTPSHPPSSNQSSTSADPRQRAHSAHPFHTHPHPHPAPDHYRSSTRD